MDFSDPTTELSKTLYFSRDVLKLISPGGILVAKTEPHTHADPLVWLKEHTHIQIGTNVNTSQQVHILKQLAPASVTNQDNTGSHVS